MPALLEHLDDSTPTKLKIEHTPGIGAMWFENELQGNPVSRVEQSVLQARRQRQGEIVIHDHVESYIVKVGDVCFVAVGQIAGRRYLAVRPQMTACTVLNSPTHDPELCAEVRAMWTSDDARQKLLDSLLLDYATRGKFNGESLDGVYLGSSLQISAAMRLLFYFPEESGALIAERLDQLDVSRTGPPNADPASEPESSALITREVANGVSTDWFIAAVGWSKHPTVLAAIKRIEDRTDDERILEILRMNR